MGLIARAFDASDSGVELTDIAGLSTLAAHISLAAHTAWVGAPVDLGAFGVGAGAIIGAISAAGWMKGKQRAVDPTCNGGGDVRA